MLLLLIKSSGSIMPLALATNSSAAGALQIDVARRRMNFHHWTAAVQPAVRGKRLRAIRSAFARDVNIRKIRSDAVSIAQIDAGAHSHCYIRRDVNRDVPRPRLDHGIAALAPGVDQLHDDATRSSLDVSRRHPVEFNASPTRLSMHVALGRSKMDAAAASVNIDRPIDIAKIDAASTGGNLGFAVALLELDTSPASLDGGALPRGLNIHAAAARFGDHLAIRVVNLNRSAASVQADVSGNSPYVDSSAPGLGIYTS